MLMFRDRTAVGSARCRWFSGSALPDRFDEGSHAARRTPVPAASQGIQTRCIAARAINLPLYTGKRPIATNLQPYVHSAIENYVTNSIQIVNMKMLKLYFSTNLVVYL